MANKRSGRSFGSISRLIAIAIVSSITIVVVPSTAGATTSTLTTDPPPSDFIEIPEGGIPPAQARAALGDDWASSSDLAATTVGLADGIAVMVARAKEGYAWETAAFLGGHDPEAGQWISNACVTSSGRYMAVVFAPRTATNDEAGFYGAASAAIIDLETGLTTTLGAGYTMAYFNPGCGADDTVAITRFEDSGALTRVASVAAATGEVVTRVDVKGQATSALPDGKGNLYAAAGSGIVRIDAKGRQSTLATTAGNAYDLTLDRSGRLAYVAAESDSVAVAYVVDPRSSKAVALARGPLTQLGLEARGDRLLVLGEGVQLISKSSTNVEMLPSASGLSQVSSQAGLVISSVKPAGIGSAEMSAEDVARTLIAATVPETGVALEFAAEPELVETEVRALEPGMSKASAASEGFTRPASFEIESFVGAPGSIGVAVNSPTNPSDDSADRYCAVARNDPNEQAYQPKPRQVEWAVDRAVKGDLMEERPLNWRGLGMANYKPQVMFPRVTLAGGGTIPPQVVLGVLMQESNLWQASRHVAPGASGNPLIGDFYGSRPEDGEPASAIWDIDFPEADCGYGVGQITDGMRLPGKERVDENGNPIETALSADKQRAIALDYAANVAMTVRMLGQKWNQLAAAGMTINNGDANRIENWYFATWIYNTGFYPNTGSGPWGVGWFNNPQNPVYSPTRSMFMSSAADAANPQNWPYPEKILGWAAFGSAVVETQMADSATRTYPASYVGSFRTAWWNSETQRSDAVAPRNTFCSIAVNDCNWWVSTPCSLDPPKCWWHGPATWKSNCATTCGYGFERFPDSYSLEVHSMAPTLPASTLQLSFPPRCTGPAPGALIVDDTTHAPAREGCASAATQGSFQFQFVSPDSNGQYSSKVDLHQIGAGFNSHFYFSHTREANTAPDNTSNRLKITGTWSLGQTLDQWTRVWVHLPDHAGWTDQAAYKIKYAAGSNGTQTRYLSQRRFANSWVSLGVFDVDGVVPTVTLDNLTSVPEGVDIDDIAWDAVAFQPLSAKPTDFVVALGDSFSSGEGAGSYTSYSDHSGQNDDYTNNCHVSNNGWIRKTTLPGDSETIGQRADSSAASLDFHFLACSGAESENLLPYIGLSAHPVNAEGEDGASGTNRQVSQMDLGYLDENTTLVTLSIGGNDMRFAPIIRACIPRYATVVPCNVGIFLAGDGTEDIATATERRLQYELPDTLATVLDAIKDRAPNAVIALVGYPKLFESGASCVLINNVNMGWLNQLSEDLTEVMDNAAAIADSPSQRVVFVDPQPKFTGHNLCTSQSAINGLNFTLTPGDKPFLTVPVPGPNFGMNASQQSVHPNSLGTDYYAAALQEGLVGVYP